MDTLAGSFEEFLSENGVYIVHIARRPDAPCPLCSGIEADSECVTCLGTGLRVTIAPVLVCATHPTNSYVGQINEPIGVIGNHVNMYYCRPTVLVHENDWFARVTWSVPTPRVLTHGQVIAIHEISRLQTPIPYYGENGTLVYYSLGVHDVDAASPVISRALRARPIS